MDFSSQRADFLAGLGRLAEAVQALSKRKGGLAVF